MEKGQVLEVFEIAEGKFKKVYDGEIGVEACEQCCFYNGKACIKNRSLNLEDSCASELFHWEQAE